MQCVDFDNLDQHLISDLFINTYYNKRKPSDYNSSQLIDSIHKRREVRLFPKMARSGHLYVNHYIMENVGVSSCGIDRVKTVYVYNNREVITYKDVLHLLRLRERFIRVIELLKDEQLGIITVLINTH